MSRWKAAAIHLSASLLVGVALLSLLLLVWYPPPYFHAAGADELVLLLIGADIALGPLLTLIVFRHGKKGLKLDLFVIALLQISAMAYGAWVVLESRPVFLVAAAGRFSLISAADIDPQDLAKGSRPEFQSLSWTGPITVAAQLPTDEHERSELIFSGLKGRDIDKLPQYFVEYSKEADALLRKAKSVDAVPAIDAASKELLDNAVRESGKSPEQLVWLPLTARKADLIMLLDKADGTPLAAVAISPWPED